MRGYLSVIGAESGTVPVESRAEIYRDPGETQDVLAEVGGREYGLDVADPTVSRRKDGRSPVVIAPRDDCLVVRNQNNTNGVTVRTNRDETDLGEGHVERVRRDATVEVGYQTELKLTVEREARVEVREGDYVAGDKVESNTEVVDSVLNRSDVGADSSTDEPTSREETTVVEDSVVNRSSVGGVDGADDSPATADSDESDTRDYCEVHQRTYTGVCPECAEEGRSGTDASERASGSDGPGEVDDTKFCLYCGEEIPQRAGVCPDCGESL